MRQFSAERLLSATFMGGGVFYETVFNMSGTEIVCEDKL